MLDFEKLGLGKVGENPSEEFEKEEPKVVEEQNIDDSEDEFESYIIPSNAEEVSYKKIGEAKIVVVGIGGGGNNAVDNMIRAGIESAHFVVMNTDMQALSKSLVEPSSRVQIGEMKTGGLGAGANPEVGRASAEESIDKIRETLEDTDLLFITAGMGGGTGTGAAPIIAKVAKEMGILTVAVVTKPFDFEGVIRMRNAEIGIRNLSKFVDTLLVIPNQKLLEVLNANVSFKRAFEIADDVLRQAVQGVTDVIANHSLINLDFADVRTILLNKGLAHMGMGKGKGENRILSAVKGAVYSPLLETDIEGATGIIVNIKGGEDMMLSEVESACSIIKEVADDKVNMIVGTGLEPGMTDIEITIIATGFTDKFAKNASVSVNTKKELDKQYDSALASMQSSLNNNSTSAFATQRPMTATASFQPTPQPEQPVQSQPQIYQPRPVENETVVNASRVSARNKVPEFFKKFRKNK